MSVALLPANLRSQNYFVNLMQQCTDESVPINEAHLHPTQSVLRLSACQEPISASNPPLRSTQPAILRRLTELVLQESMQANLPNIGSITKFKLVAELVAA